MTHGFRKEGTPGIFFHDCWTPLKFGTIGPAEVKTLGTFQVQNLQISGVPYCWWFRSGKLHQLRLVVEIPLFIWGFYTSQVVQDFSHQQYFPGTFSWKFQGCISIFFGVLSPLFPSVNHRLFHIFFVPKSEARVLLNNDQKAPKRLIFTRPEAMFTVSFSYMGMSKNNGTPQIIHFNRVWNHYKPSI